MNNKLKISILFVFGIFLLTSSVSADTAKWIPVGSVGYSKEYTSTPIVIDKNNIPYISYISNGKIDTVKFNGTKWESIGEVAMSNGVFLVSLSIDNNIPYITFMDVKEKVLSIMKFNNNKWEKYISTTTIPENCSSLVLDKNKIPYISCSNIIDKNIIPTADTIVNNMSHIVMKFSNNKWQEVGKQGELFGAITGYFKCSILNFDNNNTPYLSCVKDINNPQMVISKFDGNSWLNVGNPILNTPDNDASLLFDSKNNPYISYTYVPKVNNATIKVNKFNGSSWLDLGNIESQDKFTVNNTFLISKNDIPYVAYIDLGYLSKNNLDLRTLKIKKFNNKTWVGINGSEITTINVDKVSLASDNNGVIYVVYKDGKPKTNGGYSEDKMTVMKLIDPSLPKINAVVTDTSKEEIEKTKDYTQTDSSINQQDKKFNNEISNSAQGKEPNTNVNTEPIKKIKWYHKIFSWFFKK